jgi:hypothetical protein
VFSGSRCTFQMRARVTWDGGTGDPGQPAAPSSTTHHCDSTKADSRDRSTKPEAYTYAGVANQIAMHKRTRPSFTAWSGSLMMVMRGDAEPAPLTR